MLNIVEHFLSISGEAPILGYPTYFYRFTGCNLNCEYCDTAYKNEVNFKFSEEELVADIRKQVKLYPAIKILFTGGEPLWKDRQEILLRVIKRVPETDFYIETNGAIEITETALKNCHFVCDYKGPASGELNSFEYKNLKRLHSERDCMKFVIEKNDLTWFADKVKEIKNINNKLELFVSPVFGKLELDVLTKFILDNKLPVNISIQLHKIIWPTTDRGV